MRLKLPSSFDDLVTRHYGGTGKGVLDTPTLESLFASYYGQTCKGKGKKKKTTRAVTMSVTTDDGEVLHQAGFVEYVVQQSQADCNSCEEYVVQNGTAAYLPAPEIRSTAMGNGYDCGDVDTLLAPQQGNMPAPMSTPRQSTSFSAPEPAPTYVPPAQAPAPAPVPTSDAAQQPKSTDPNDEEFFKDLQEIISGNGRFNQETKKVEPARPATPPPAPLPNAENGQAIFDRIAQSMSYANAYDLGSVDMENRFAEFDRMADDRRAPTVAKLGKSNDGPRPPVINTTEFIEDMKDIADQARDSATKMADSMTPPTSQAQSVDYSRQFFDSGEHAMMGDESYDGMLHVGPHPGVAFTYGEIIACADLFATPEKMMAASIADLTKIKSLIDRNIQYYKGGKTDPSGNISDEDWQGPTHKEYLKLAENNYEHFSPYYYYPKASFAKDVHKHGTNKSQWERFHKQAIDEARKMFIDQKNAGTSIFYEWPLIINAFGDHFLTDAFSAGHLVNKEEIIALFKNNFYSGSSLNKDGKAFFGRVAQLAFQGEVAQKFSALETAGYPVCKWGWCIMWHPNINSVSRFTDLLVQAAEQQPDRIANFALKALHDKLNKDGVEVTNRAGDGVWTEYGDGFLSLTNNLPIIKKAVQKSIANINDPAIMGSNVNYGAFFDNVWKHVPTPTATANAKITSLAKEFTDPTSTIGAAAAAEIIKNSVNSMIKLLIDEGKLKRA